VDETSYFHDINKLIIEAQYILQRYDFFLKNHSFFCIFVAYIFLHVAITLINSALINLE